MIDAALLTQRADTCSGGWLAPTLHVDSLPRITRSLRMFVFLVALANKVILQSLDGLCCVSWLLGLAVVSDQDSLLRLGDDDAATTLLLISILPG
jgi:hypothetical protein